MKKKYQLFRVDRGGLELFSPFLFDNEEDAIESLKDISKLNRRIVILPVYAFED